MSEINNIFSLPSIVLEKVKLSEILDLLRDRVNRHYMPKSNGRIKYNSKPEYTQFASQQFPDMPDIHPLEPSGYFCLDRDSQRQPIFYNLHIAQFQIVINLVTEEAFIRLNNSELRHTELFVKWEDTSNQTIPLMRDELKEIIEIYG